MLNNIIIAFLVGVVIAWITRLGCKDDFSNHHIQKRKQSSFSNTEEDEDEGILQKIKNTLLPNYKII